MDPIPDVSQLANASVDDILAITYPLEDVDSNEPEADPYLILGLHPLCHSPDVGECLIASHLAFVATSICNYLRAVRKDDTATTVEDRDENRVNLPKSEDFPEILAANNGRWTRGMAIVHIAEKYPSHTLVAFGNTMTYYSKIRKMWYGTEASERSALEMTHYHEGVEMVQSHITEIRDYLDSDKAFQGGPGLPRTVQWPRYDESIDALREWLYALEVSAEERDTLKKSMLNMVVEAMLSNDGRQWDGRTMYQIDGVPNDFGLSHAPVGFWLPGDDTEPRGVGDDEGINVDMRDVLHPHRVYVAADEPDVHGDILFQYQRRFADGDAEAREDVEARIERLERTLREITLLE